MPTISQNISLKPFNTFGIDVKAKYFAEVNSADDVIKLLQKPEFENLPLLILGGGSNILFTKDFNGLVIKNELKGIEITAETETEVWVKAASGVVWHELVLFCVSKNYGGIENLSLIPGTVGAAPIQNIGAYGAELKDVFVELEALELSNLELKKFYEPECGFGYRDSIFKHEAKDKYFITSVTLRLQKNPQVNTAYSALQKLLKERGITNSTIAEVSKAVCDIRRSKLPDPAVIGNAGSFFKNPEISKADFMKLKEDYPHLPGYMGEHIVKIPAAWLIESLGWKGKRVGETGSHKDQALVLVNYGNAAGEEIKNLATEIQKSVEEKFGILLMPEVNMI